MRDASQALQERYTAQQDAPNGYFAAEAKLDRLQTDLDALGAEKERALGRLATVTDAHPRRSSPAAR